MKKLAILGLLAVAGASQAVTWDSGTGLGWAIPDSPAGPTSWTFSPTVGGGALVQFDIFMSPAHTWRSDLAIWISGPSNAPQFLALYNHEDGSGDFISAFFNTGTGVALPATGNLDSNTSGTTYLASGGALSTVDSSAGLWTLTAVDTAGADTGTIDRIRVTTDAVPEPGTFIALGLGGVALAAMRRRRK